MSRTRNFVRAYGAAHFSKSLLWYASELLFTFVLTEIYGLSPLVAGGVLAISLLMNAAADLVAGAWMSRVAFDVGWALRLQLFGAVLAALAFAAFGLSGLATGELRPVLIASALFSFRLAYPVLDVPQNALLALAGAQSGGEHRLSSLRMIAGGCARLTVAALFTPLLQGRRLNEQVVNFAVLAAIAAALALAGAIGLFRSGRSLEAGPPQDGDSPTEGRGPGFSRVFAALLVALGLVAAASAAFAQSEPYLASYVIAARLQGGLTMTLVAAGSIVSQPAWSALGQRRGLPSVLSAAGALWALGAAALMVQLLAGSSSPSAISLALAAFAYGSGSGGTMMALWAIVARRARASPRRTPKAFAAVGAASKTGGAISALSTAALLSSAQYHERAHAGSLALACLSPILVGLFCVALGLILALRTQGLKPVPT